MIDKQINTYLGKLNVKEKEAGGIRSRQDYKMTLYNCEFHSEVENDYNDAYEWYENQKKGLGEQFFKFCQVKN